MPEIGKYIVSYQRTTRNSGTMTCIIESSKWKEKKSRAITVKIHKPKAFVNSSTGEKNRSKERGGQTISLFLVFFLTRAVLSETALWSGHGFAVESF